MSNIREITLNILMEYDRDGVRKPSLLKDSLAKYDYMDTRDKAFMKRVVDGCIERQIQLDYILNSFSKTRSEKMQPFIRSLLRMSVYQIMFMDAVPDSAACNEAVKLAQKHKFAGLKGFVNGVLRNVARNKDKIEYPDRSLNGGIDYLSVVYSMPDWICRMWTETYGFDRTEEMLKAFLLPRPTVVRLNTCKVMTGEILTSGNHDISIVTDKSTGTGKSTGTDKGAGTDKGTDTDTEADIVAGTATEDGLQTLDSYISDLESAGAIVKRSNILPYALELEKTDNIRFLPGFDEGKFFVQDVSSMLVTEIADPRPGQIVIDVCAAPGGKSLHAAERIENGTVLSRDVSERKCDLIRENAERMGLPNVRVELHDARVHDKELENRADVLYMDLPCSGLGIIGRKNDIKYNVTKKSLSELSKLQWEIIKTAWDYVKPGGILMYSTCTVNRAENEDMVARICKELPFETVDFSKELPGALKACDNDPDLKAQDGHAAKCRDLEAQAGKGFIQLLPGEYGTDGFFIAKLRRTLAGQS